MINEDHDAHVRAYIAFHGLCTVFLALHFTELARAECERSERDLIAAMNRAERAGAHLRRTTDTLEGAIRLHAMGRT